MNTVILLPETYIFQNPLSMMLNKDKYEEFWSLTAKDDCQLSYIGHVINEERNFVDYYEIKSNNEVFYLSVEHICNDWLDLITTFEHLPVKIQNIIEKEMICPISL